MRATPGALRENQHLLKQAVKNRDRLLALESEAAMKIDGVELVFGMKAGKNRKLYGSVTTRDIAAALLEKTGVDIDRRRISERPVRELGIHEIPVRIAGEISPVLQIVILREEEVQPYLDGQQVESLSEWYEDEPVVEAVEDEAVAVLEFEAAEAPAVIEEDVIEEAADELEDTEETAA